MVQYTAAMVLSVAVLCSVTLLSQASPVDWWKSEFAREEEKEILEEVAAHIISELESEMMIQQDEDVRLCPELSAPIYGTVGYGNREPGDVATYSCRHGYRLVGSEMRICERHQDGIPKWSGKPSVCEITVIFCPLVNPIPNGDMGASKSPIPGRGFPVDTVVNYTCDNGYLLRGEDTRICLRSGEWHHPEPRCLPHVHLCRELPAPLNGAVDYGNREPGDVAIYSCRDGYRLVGQETRICERHQDGIPKWSGNHPVCEIIIICPLDNLPIANGEFSPSSGPITGPGGSLGYAVGTVVNYRCVSDHFELRGESSIICLESGEWSHPPPSCVIVCPLVNPIPHGGMNADRSPVPGTGGRYPVDTVITYTCDNGYLLRGEDKRTCLRSGEWDHPEPSCEPRIPLLCPELPDIANGAVSYFSREPGATASYSCNNQGDKFKLSGTAVRRCIQISENEARWSGEEPKCIPLCPELPDIANGTVSYSSREPGATASYSCNNQDDKFTLDGTTIRICTQVSENEARWSGEEPKCVPLCPIPRLPTGEGYAEGGVEYGDRKPDDVASYTCKGYAELVDGPERRTCLENGMWSGSDPYCRPIICSPESLPITDGEFSPSRGLIRAGPGGSLGYGVGTVITYTCTSDGFELRGESRRTCLESGEWDHPRPSCVEVTCPLVNPIPNGHMYADKSPIPGQGFPVGTVVTYTCNKGYLLWGEDTRTCLRSGEWDHPEPSCFAAKCPELKLIANPKSVYEVKKQIERDRPKNYQELLSKYFFTKYIEGNYNEGSKAHLTCENGWTLDPDSPSFQTCERNTTTGELYWTKPGICVYGYWTTRPIYGGTG